VANPHDITKQFEAALCEYTGAKYAVTTTSCTQAILMALAWHIQIDRWISDQRVDMTALPEVLMPKRSYVGVPAAIRNAGGRPTFWGIDWTGEYRFGAYPVWDSARRFTSGMYKGVDRVRRWRGNTVTQVDIPIDHSGAMQCVSFHATKILADSQGGAILHDNDEADAWLRRARFDGRTEGADPKTDQVQYPSWHAYLSPDVAARLLWKLQGLPRHNADLPNSDYPDLSLQEAFRP
jgi:dTDP-4-amino-4,6-dideoxygalactose transaminase